MSEGDFSAADFRRRVLGHRAGAVERDADGGRIGAVETGLFLPGSDLVPDGLALKDAAVLVAVVDAGPAARVILTQRALGLRKHSGQIAFPGGVIDANDVSAEAAALREAQEEIGLGRTFVDIVGRLPAQVTGTGFRITPVLGVVRPGFSLMRNPAEVDEVFEVPLSFLMDSANHVPGRRLLGGSERVFYEMPYGERHIWGITAGILRTIYERFYS